MSQKYIPGVCNIGEAEIDHRRYAAGFGSMVISIALFFLLNFFQAKFYVYILIFVPVYISVLGFVQAKEKFCAGYGRAGLYNTNGEFGESIEVIGKLNRNKDRIKANAIYKKSAIIAIVITLCTMLIDKII